MVLEKYRNSQMVRYPLAGLSTTEAEELIDQLLDSVEVGNSSLAKSSVLFKLTYYVPDTVEEVVTDIRLQIRRILDA